MWPDGRAGLRRRLARIVTQAWLLGAGGGTAVDGALLWWQPHSMVGTMGWRAMLAIPVALLVSGLPFLLGLGSAMAASVALVWHRLLLCAAMPVAVTIVWLVTTGRSGAGGREPSALVFLDAAVAAAWCWHRTRGMSATSSARLAAIFD